MSHCHKIIRAYRSHFLKQFNVLSCRMIAMFSADQRLNYAKTIHANTTILKLRQFPSTAGNNTLSTRREAGGK